MLQKSTPLHAVGTCPSVRDLSILMAHLFLGGAPSLLPYVPRLLLEALSLPETHLDIPFLEATCHRERPGLWHLLYLLCRLTCFFRPVAVQATVVADTFGIFSHFWQGSPPPPAPDFHHNPFCLWLFVSPALLASVICSGMS